MKSAQLISYWPLSLEELTQWPEAHRLDVNALLRGEKALDRGSILKYRLLNGNPMETRVGDILIHMATHAIHHRAQIASWSVAAGHKPPSLDYILYAREKVTEL
jgi:uncharacterized damage-inducible protein DinB